MVLSAEFIEKQKASLLTEKSRLEEKIKSLKKYPDYGDLEDDNTQELVDYENNMSAEESLAKLLNKVKLALRAIERGEYGQCRACQREIEEGRLEAVPFADLCVTCEKKK